MILNSGNSAEIRIKRFGVFAFAVFGFLVVVSLSFLGKSEPAWYAYAVGDDLRIHMANLATGELEWTSRELEELNHIKPQNGISSPHSLSEIEINPERSILYVGVDSGGFMNQFSSLFAFNLNQESGKVFEKNYKDVFRIFYHSSINFLYVVSLGKSLKLNSESGESVGEVEGFMVTQEHELSSDGNMNFRVTPRSYWKRDWGVLTFPGIVSVGNLETGEVNDYFLEDYPDMDFIPPWGSETPYFVYVRYGWDQYGEKVYGLEIWNRRNKEIVASNYNFPESMKNGSWQNFPTHIPGTGNVALPVESDIVVFDGSTAEEISRIHVGVGLLSNVVVSNKPVNRDSRR